METLDNVTDPDARRISRDLMETTLDLHGIALAKTLTICQAAGGTVVHDLLANDYVAAVALLHGLHPQDAGERLRAKIAEMHPHWGVRGFRVDIAEIKEAKARLCITLSSEGSRANADALRREVEQTLTDCAPDLDSIEVYIRAQSSAPARGSDLVCGARHETAVA